MKARILVNHYSPTPNKFTGISVYTWKILEALARFGRHEYVLATNWDLSRLPETIRQLNIEMVQRPSHRSEWLATLNNTLAYPTLTRRLGCQAIFHPQPAALLAGLRKSVVVVHDLYRVSHPHLHSLKQRLQWRYLTAHGLRRAGRLLAVSETTRNAVVSAYPDVSGRIHVVHEASPLDPPAAPLPRPPIEGAYGLMVANITTNKNVQLLIGALKQLADRNIRPQIVLVGRDDGEALPKLLTGHHNLALIRLEGLSDQELSAYYAHARFYVNTSLTEGFCLPLLEAQTFGTAVICSDLPVLREVAGDGALFVDPHNPVALAAAIEQLIKDDSAVEDLGRRAIANVQRFSWRRAAIETEAVLDEVIAAPS